MRSITEHKLRTYNTFKNNISIENDVPVCNSKHKRSLIAQFSSGIYRLKCVDITMYV